MSKTFLIAALVASINAKVRPLHPAVGGTENALTKSHQRIVRDQLVKAPRSCQHGALVEAGHENSPTVGAGSCKAQCLFQDD